MIPDAPFPDQLNNDSTGKQSLFVPNEKAGHG
jgi:hypothetical protein